MDWQKGRQDSGYFKKVIRRSEWPIGHDILLLKYPPGSEIDWHTDEVENRNHYRLNVELNNSYTGGVFKSRHDVLFSFGPVTVFRPDENEHMVTEVKNGTRYVFSFGVALPSGESDPERAID